MKALKEAGIQNIISKSRRTIGVNISEIDCDYYAAISGDLTQLNAFAGEYMTNYSWAEFTLGNLVEQNTNRK